MTTKKTLRVLHLEDDPDYADLVRAMFAAEGIDADFMLVTGGRDFETAISSEQFDLILADYLVPGYSGLQALHFARESAPQTPFILVSGTLSESAAVECLKSGATDYVLKQRPERLVPAVRRAAQEADSRAERECIQAELSRRDRRFRALTENALDVVALLDLGGSLQYVSPSAHRVLGFSPPDVVGRSIFEFVHPEDLPEAQRAFVEVLGEERGLRSVSCRAKHADGGWRFLEAVAQNLVNDPDIQGIVLNARDITDRKQAEIDVRESAQQYRLIFDGNPIPMWVFDHETLAFLEVNDAALLKYGYSRAEFLSMKLGDIRVSEEDPALFEYLHKLMGAERAASMDLAGTWRHRRKDGSVFDVEIKWSPVSFRGRRASLTMAIDITERKRREHRDLALSLLGQRLSSATSATAAARIIREVATELFSWDAFNLDLYDEATQSVYPLLTVDTSRDGKRFEVPNEETARKASPLACQVVQHGARLILREEGVSNTNLLRPIGDVSRPSASLMFAPVRSGARTIGTLSIQSYSPRAYDSQDLSLLQTLADHCGGALERIHAEQALRESELLFHSVWENSLDGMRLTDAEGRVFAVNEAYCRMVGMTSEELQDRSFTAIYADSEDPDGLLMQYQENFSMMRAECQTERTSHLRSGKTVRLEERNLFVERPGRPPLLFTVLRDVTTQKQLEEQLRQSQKMEAIGQLAGGVAHDFNNILTVIHGHATLVSRDSASSEGTVRSAQQIILAADRAAGLTRQLLAFSRRQLMQLRSLELNEVVGNMTRMLGRILGEDIALQLHYSPQPVAVEADRGMLEQVLLNLAVNSRDAMPHGGVLSIRIAHREVTETQPSCPDARLGHFVCLSVTDSGCGISSDHLPHIFEPFFTTKEIGKGTGLGLATVYGIIKQHQGWIEVESQVNRGTQFRVFMPTSRNPVSVPDDPSAVTQVRGGDETILVVEDEAPLRELVCQLLAEHGYRILEADSGVKALKIWEDTCDEIDLVLTDLVMPDRMNGRELAERLWAQRPDLKIVFTSGYSAEVVGKEFVLKPDLVYLQKPYHPQKLAATIRDCLDQKRTTEVDRTAQPSAS